jgi:capsular polysaccharide transport system permease protein
MTASFFSGLKVQKRVVWALMLRETKTLFGKHKLGYLWVVINAAFQVGVFWAIREVAGFQPPHGMSTPVFLLGGFIPWFIFSNGVSDGMSAIWANRSLLTYPQVFPLDPLIARIWLQSAVQTLVFIILLCVAWGMGQHVAIANPHAILVALFLALLLGFGGGAICSALNLMWPTTSQLVPMLMRVLFFTSGLFFSVVDLPAAAQKILFFNPVTHIIEYLRYGFVDGYGVHYISLPYAFSFALLLLVVGLLLERYSRRYLDRMV